MNRILPAFIIGMIVLVLISMSLFVVDQREFAVKFAFGEIKEVIGKPGLHFKLPPPFQNIVYMEKRILTMDSPETDKFLTAEKKNILVDSYVKWRIFDPKLFFTSLRINSSNANILETVAEDQLRSIMKAALADEITKRTIHEVVSGERDQVMKDVVNMVFRKSKLYGIEIVDMRLKRVELEEAASNFVYRRMEAERKRVANELRSTGAAESEKIRADADKQREVIVAQAYRDAQNIKGQGDAKATAIYGQAFGQNPEFYAFYRSLEAYRNSFKNRNDLLVIDPSSEFFKYMKNGAGAARGK